MIEKQNKQAVAFARKVTGKYLKAIKCDTERDREVYCKSSTDYFNLTATITLVRIMFYVACGIMRLRTVI